MAIELSHFSAALIFSVLASTVFAITQKNTTKDMVKYGLQCFAYFIVGVLAAGWVMYFLKR